MSGSEPAQGGVEALLAEQLRWLRAAAMPGVRQTVATALEKDQQRRAYELCDGTKTSAEIGKAVDASPATMSRWTTEWRNLGIVYESEEGLRHLISLKTLGLPLEVEGA
jgi:predicted transcriptional regulator